MFTKHSSCMKSCDTDRHNDWQEVSLASACIKVTDGSHFSPIPRSHGRPIANVKDLRPGFVDILSCTKIAEEDFYELVRNGCDVQRHDVLLSKDGTIGKVVVYEQDEPLVALSSIAILRPGKALDPFFLGQVLQSSQVTKQIGIFAGGSALHRLVLRDINRLFIPLPSLAEQQRIAAVLDTVDEAITKTEAVIAKLKQVHAGLLHDLLIRGLNEHGQFRDPIAHPEQFQDSLLGRIPREWRVCGVLDIAPSDRQAILTGPFGAQLGQADFVREGIPVLRIGNVQSGYIDLSNLQFVTEEKAQMLERFRIKCGDLLFARQGATTGRNALANERVEGYVINYHIIRVAVNRDSCSPVFLHALFNSENVQRQINRDKGRGTREGINTGEITALRFALPPIEEQHRAVAVMRAQSQLVEAEVELLGKLHLIKSGLMSDLLTGRVRVPEGIAVAL